ncbi:MAG: SET domain-containing protein [Verrucomicrobia bacterium]|nr:SET domain-containing protein [Verrucomicrobiota bacterium]
MSFQDVESRPSPIAGLGLFARRDFAPGERISPYSGTVTGQPPSEASSDGKVYALEISPGRWLDGSSADNPSRHANHACHPNAELIWHDPESAAWLTALQPIAAGEEITFDYGFSLAESLFHPCACGAVDCAGRIIATPLRPALRRHLRFSRPRD